MALTRQEERALRDTGRRALEQAARAGAAKAGGSTLQRTFATVTGIGEDGTLNIDIGSTAHPQPMLGIRMLTGCRGVKVGDRVVVDTLAHVSIVVGVLAHDNDPYVTETEHDADIAGVESDLASAMVPRYVSLTPNENLANYSAYANSSYQMGRLVVLQCGIIFGKSTTLNSDALRLFTLPADCRPAEDVARARMALCICDGGETAIARGINVTASGSVQFQNASGGTQGINGIFVYGIGYAAAS